MYVSDLRHFLDMPPDAPAPARRMANHLALVVRAATADDPGIPWLTALPCSRRPGRRPCPGTLLVYRTEVPPSIDWRCVSCGDQGVISGWAHSPFDLRVPGGDTAGVKTAEAVIAPDHAAALRTIPFLDRDAERLVFRAAVCDEGVVLSGEDETFEDLLECVAAEANHTDDRRRRRHLGEAFDLLSGALKRRRRT